MKTMDAVSIDMPEFRSEAEEAAWWDQNQELIADLLLKHGRRGTVPTKSVSGAVGIPDRVVTEGPTSTAPEYAPSGPNHP